MKRKLYFLKSKENIDSIQNSFVALEISWKIVPRRSQHHDGIWEAAIKNSKYHIV